MSSLITILMLVFCLSALQSISLGQHFVLIMKQLSNQKMGFKMYVQYYFAFKLVIV